MGIARYTPWQFVCYLHSLQPNAGQVALKQYMSKTASNGGNDNTHELFTYLRFYPDGGVEKAPTMNTLVGAVNCDLALKGQGSGPTFVAIWNFMSKNMERLKTRKMKIYGPRKDGDVETKVLLAETTIYQRYFLGKSEAEGFQQMVADRFFGIDCIGFVGQYMVYAGEWPAYKGMAPRKWPNHYCKIPVLEASKVKALDFLVWATCGHIAIIDEVFETVDGVVHVDVCQSSTNGPQLNQKVYLKACGKDGDRMRYKFINRGSPSVPVGGEVYIMRREGFTLDGGFSSY